MLFAAPVQFLFMIALPIVVGVWMRRRGFGTWRVFFAGAVAFIASQVVHIPMLIGLTALAKVHGFPHPSPAWKDAVNAVVLGLAAGACEEPARWLVLRFWVKDARGTKSALMLGAGHGGVESFILGLLAAVNFVAMLVMQKIGPGALGVPADQASKVAEAVAKYWSTPWYMALVGGFERAMAMTVHLAASVLVMRAIETRKARWLGLAILFHAAVDGVAVYAATTWGPMAAEASVVVFVLVAIAILFALRERPGRAVVAPVPY